MEESGEPPIEPLLGVLVSNLGVTRHLSPPHALRTGKHWLSLEPPPQWSYQDAKLLSAPPVGTLQMQITLLKYSLGPFPDKRVDLTPRQLGF